MQVDNNSPISETYTSKPLIKLHGKITSSFHSLPSEGKLLEIAKRVVIVVIGSFAYIILGLLALVEITINSVFKNRVVKNGSNEPSENQIQKPLLSVASECNAIQRLLIFIVNGSSQVQSAKIFIDIQCNHKKFSKDYVIKQLDSSPFNQVFISTKLDEILTEAKAFLEIQNTDELSSRWAVLLKDAAGVFHEAHGSRKYFFDNTNYRTEESNGIAHDIAPNNLEAHFNLLLKFMKRESKPQLDNQLNLV